MTTPELSLNTKLVVTLTVIVVVVSMKLLYAQFVYDDWSCAFANCVKVQETAR